MFLLKIFAYRVYIGEMNVLGRGPPRRQPPLWLPPQPHPARQPVLLRTPPHPPHHQVGCGIHILSWEKAQFFFWKISFFSNISFFRKCYFLKFSFFRWFDFLKILFFFIFVEDDIIFFVAVRCRDALCTGCFAATRPVTPSSCCCR